MQMRDWDHEWRDGRWDFLGKEAEQARLRAAARMIGTHGPGALIDLGSGDGGLLRHLDPVRTPRCLCVDISSAALARLPEPEEIRVERLAVDLETHCPAPLDAAAIACAEILYYLADPAAVLARWAGACRGLRLMVATIAEPGTRFPQWQASVAQAYDAVARLGWPLIESEAVERDGQRWTVAAWRPEQACG